MNVYLKKSQSGYKSFIPKVVKQLEVSRGEQMGPQEKLNGVRTKLVSFLFLFFYFSFVVFFGGGYNSFLIISFLSYKHLIDKNTIQRIFF